MENKEFNYTYTAPSETERKEIASIRKRYQLPETESKLERLRRLDARVKRSANIVALTVGIFGCLLFGAGMSCTLELTEYFVLGVVLSVVGIVPIVLAYPLYNFVLKRSKKKYGDEILRLSEELLNEKEN